MIKMMTTMGAMTRDNDDVDGNGFVNDDDDDDDDDDEDGDDDDDSKG